MTDISSGYPKALSYSIKQMADNMSRIGVKLTPDRTTGIAPNDTITFKLPNSSLVDMRSLNFFYKFSTSSTTGTFIHPRYSSTLIERVSVIINGQTISITPAYAYLYNTLMDLEGSSFDQLSKRNVCEFFDPSIRVTTSDPTSSADVSLQSANWITSGTSAPNKIDGAITHWLGFLGSCQPGVIDTSSLGDVYIQIQFSTAYVLPSTINASAQTLAGASFTLDDVYATCDVISFSSDTYYNALASKLGSGGGLNIGFYEYLNARFASITKSSGVNVTWNISANSLDQLIGTLQKTDAYTTWKPMVVFGSNNDGGSSNVFTMSQIASDPITKTDNTGTIRTEKLGDGFMNCYAMIRTGQAIKESRWSINNRTINYGFLTPKEIFIQTLQSLGYNQLDLGMNGLNFCIFSLQHFLKYYFAHIIDLTIQDSRDFWISGLNSLGSTLSITWECNFSGSSNSQTAIPVIYARLSKILNVRDGRNLSVI